MICATFISWSEHSPAAQTASFYVGVRVRVRVRVSVRMKAAFALRKGLGEQQAPSARGPRSSEIVLGVGISSMA